MTLEQRLRGAALFAGASPGDLTALRRQTTLRALAPGERLIEEGDPSREVYLLLTGKVGVFYSSAEGAHVLVKVFSAPAFFGEMEAFFARPRQEYVEAFEPAEVACMAIEAFEAFLAKDHRACLVLLKDVAARLAIAAYHERALSFDQVERRVANLFLTFYDAYGAPGPAGHEIRYDLTYELIARCLGVTEKSIERTLGRWQRDDLVKRSKSRYTLCDLGALKDLADPERLSLHTTLGSVPEK